MKRSHSYNNDLNYSYITPINICIIGAGRAGNFHVNSLLINKQYKFLLLRKEIKFAIY